MFDATPEYIILSSKQFDNISTGGEEFWSSSLKYSHWFRINLILQSSTETMVHAQLGIFYSTFGQSKYFSTTKNLYTCVYQTDMWKFSQKLCRISNCSLNIKLFIKLALGKVTWHVPCCLINLHKKVKGMVNIHQPFIPIIDSKNKGNENDDWQIFVYVTDN